MGLGFTVLPHYAYEEFKNKSKLELVKLKKNISNEIYIVRKKHRPLPKRYKYIEDYLKDNFWTFLTPKTKKPEINSGF